MSVKVDLAELGRHLADHDFGYLMTVGDDLRAHAVAVRPTLAGGALQVTGLGRRTGANLQARPQVSLVWPPRVAGGYSLIVDGSAAHTDTGARVVPEHAVLHRPADHDTAGTGESATGCGNDCVPLES